MSILLYLQCLNADQNSINNIIKILRKIVKPEI